MSDLTYQADSAVISAASQERLGALLEAYGWLWRISAYDDDSLPWAERVPGLAQSMLALDDDVVSAAWHDDEVARRLIAPILPEADELSTLTELRHASVDDDVSHSYRLQRDIPGRKEQQIRAMLAAVHPVGGEVVDWCGGKGHLGRWLAHSWRASVTTIERDEHLCAEGRVLAQRARVTQSFVARDVLHDDVASLLSRRHAVALHACGDLHRTLLKQAAGLRVPAIDVVPCCYHVSATEQYPFLSSQSHLPLTRLEARMAVTGDATSTSAEQRRRDRLMAWKFGFRELAKRVLNEDADGDLVSGEKRWLKGDFAQFCRAMAVRRGWMFPAETPWIEGERYGRLRLHQARRLSIPRLAFRRALEVYLAADVAMFMTEHDYRVRVTRLCERHVTPRNILLSARAK